MAEYHYRAELAQLSGAADVETAFPAAYDQSYVYFPAPPSLADIFNNTNQTPSTITFTIEVPETAWYTLHFRYSNESNSDAYRNLLVDGADYPGTIAFDNLAAGNNWAFTNTSLELSAGQHTLTLSNKLGNDFTGINSTDPAIMLDHLLITTGVSPSDTTARALSFQNNQNMVAMTEAAVLFNKDTDAFGPYLSGLHYASDWATNQLDYGTMWFRDSTTSKAITYGPYFDSTSYYDEHGIGHIDYGDYLPTGEALPVTISREFAMVPNEPLLVEHWHIVNNAAVGSETLKWDVLNVAQLNEDLKDKAVWDEKREAWIVKIDQGDGKAPLYLAFGAMQETDSQGAGNSGEDVRGDGLTPFKTSQPSTQQVDILGNWSAGTHTVTVQFINDLYDGSPHYDRNAYVDQISIDGSNVLSSPSALMYNQSIDYKFTVSNADGPKQLSLKLSEDAWQGDAQVRILVDGVPVSTEPTVITAKHDADTAVSTAAASQDLQFSAALSAGEHKIGIRFLNDAYNGTPHEDRNAYVEQIAVNGHDLLTQTDGIWTNSTVEHSFTVSPADAANGSSIFSLALSEDAWQGDAQVQVYLDGVAVTNAVTIHASHSNGNPAMVASGVGVVGDFESWGHVGGPSDMAEGTGLSLGMQSTIDLQPTRPIELYYYYTMADSLSQLDKNISLALNPQGTTTGGSPTYWFNATQNYWDNHLSQADDISSGVSDPSLDTAYLRSLVSILQSQQPEYGSFLASTNPAYEYKVWPRDSAATAIALDGAGLYDDAEKFWHWMASVQEDGTNPSFPSGSFWTNYSFWAPDEGIHFVEPEWDAQGLFLMGVYHHYTSLMEYGSAADVQKAQAFISDPTIQDAVYKSAEFIAQNINSSGFGPADNSIWEEFYLYNTFTQVTYAQGLNAARLLASAIGHPEAEAAWTEDAQTIRDAILRPTTAEQPGLWNSEKGYFVYGVTTDGKVFDVQESSTNLAIVTGLLDASDPIAVQQIANTLDNNAQNTYGIPRYTGDTFYNASPWSPGGTYESRVSSPSWPQMTSYVGIAKEFMNDPAWTEGSLEWTASVYGKGYTAPGEAVDPSTQQPLPSTMIEPVTAGWFVQNLLNYTGNFDPRLPSDIYAHDLV